MTNNVMCQASEKGKIIVNKCLDKGIHINTLKLEKLLILAHGKMLCTYNQSFFKQKVVTYGRGLIIEEVDQDFLGNSVMFDKKLPEYVCLMSKEEEIVLDVIKNYAGLNVFELNNLVALKK